VLWNRELVPQERRIAALPKSQGILFAIGCIDRAIWRFDLDFPDEHLELRTICRRFANYLSPTASPTIGLDIPSRTCFQMVDELQDLIDRYEGLGSNNSCLYLSYSILYTLCHELNAGDGMPTPYEIGGYAYQYTFYQHLYLPLLPQLRLTGGAIESDIDILERDCSECTADIRYQLAIADAILTNGRLVRADLAHRN